MSIGDRLSQLRDDLRLSQTEFAARTGTSQSAYATYERGLREPPVSVVSAACKAFKVSPAWLLLGEGSKEIKNASDLAVQAYKVTRDFVRENPADWTDEKENEFYLLCFRYLEEHANGSDEFLRFMFEKVTSNAR